MKSLLRIGEVEANKHSQNLVFIEIVSSRVVGNSFGSPYPHRSKNVVLVGPGTNTSARDFHIQFI